MRYWLALCLLSGVARADDPRAETLAARADALWAASCPVPERDGLCVRVVAFVPSRPATRCGPEHADRLVAVPRDVRQVKAALDALAEAARADPGNAVHYRQLAHVRATDLAVEHAPALVVPADHSLPHERMWLHDAEWSVRRFAHDYWRHIDDPSDDTAVEVDQRIGRLYEQLATQLFAVPLPEDLRVGPGAPDRLDAFCDAIADFATAAVENARTSYLNCLHRAARLDVADDAARVCQHALERIDPEHYPPGGELLHVPPPAPVVVPEGPTSSSTR